MKGGSNELRERERERERERARRRVRARERERERESEEKSKSEKERKRERERESNFMQIQRFGRTSQYSLSRREHIKRCAAGVCELRIWCYLRYHLYVVLRSGRRRAKGIFVLHIKEHYAH